MKTLQSIRRLVVLGSVLFCAAFGEVAAYAQLASSATRPEAPARPLEEYSIEIENGQLLMAPLKGRIDINAIWGKGEIHSMPATIENLAKFLRAADTNLNLVLSPRSAEVTVQNLKLRSIDIGGFIRAIGYATDGQVTGRPFGPAGEAGRDWTIVAGREQRTERSVEVFNISGFMDYLRSSSEKDKSAKDESARKQLEEVMEVIIETIRAMKGDSFSQEDSPDFRFHQGTDLLVIIGKPDSIEVARKVISALPGQPRLKLREDLLDTRAPGREN